ncbi:MAG: PhoX family phosphatase [Hyphomonadaceae bacterium]
MVFGARDDFPSNPRIDGGAETIGDIVARRLSRRALLRGGLALGASAAIPACATAPASGTSARFAFTEIARGVSETHVTPEGYDVDILLRWGDPLFEDVAPFDPQAQTAQTQLGQFGYNNDFIGFVPLSDERGLLCVNHEYTSTHLMLPGVASRDALTAEQCAIERTAHGASVVEIARVAGRWRPVVPSRYNRRITGDTDIAISGPAAGHPRLRTSGDPAGRLVKGTLGNCAGGITPWGTYLTAEENFDGYFSGAAPEAHAERQNMQRYGVPGGDYTWGRFDPRFDIGSEPNEPNRFGWVVEIDPRDPAAMPKKRTALGRFKHEGAEAALAPNGRVVVYMGDDQRFDYVYKFVTTRAFDPAEPEAARDLLDDGVLYVARFRDDGTVDWLPLEYGQAPLIEANGFFSQADILIEARRAADLLGATPMDRPEDIEANPHTGRVYVMLTNNHFRTPDQVSAANPRAANATGHIIEIIEPGGDLTATQSRWEILVRCGDPSDAAAGATWNDATTANGWFGSPDNCAIDPSGRLWVATDGNPSTGAADGLWALETEGPLRGTGRAFVRAPIGAEMCGPRFTPDGRTLFLAIQHPGDGEGANFENPTTRWPDFREGMPPRPSVIALYRRDGGQIGG